MEPERQAGIDEKSVAATRTSRLPCSQSKPSARSENCDPGDVESVYADAAREIKELDDSSQDEQEAKHHDGAPELADSIGRRSFVRERHKLDLSN
jgi:hypothetical protein